MANSWAGAARRAIDSHHDIAAHMHDQNDMQIRNWLLRRSDIAGIRAGTLALPETLTDWTHEMGEKPSQLPSPPLLINALRREYPGQPDDRLLRRSMWRVIAKLEPPVDTEYVRTHVDVDVPMLGFTARGAEPRNGTRIESTAYDIVGMRGGHKAKGAYGSIMMRFSDKPGKREAWLDSLRLQGTKLGLPTFLLGVHIAAAEIAHSEFYTLRTPPGRALAGIYRDVWETLAAETGAMGEPIADVVKPFEPLVNHPNAYYGRIAIAPYVQVEAAESDSRYFKHPGTFN
ncbi:MAG TPA: hypothetical protein VLE73_02065 [Candidatus Saccharimonadales bacterium]|nr:hypothetical protein [Candidatus Saccharimonadales bacterium]